MRRTALLTAAGILLLPGLLLLPVWRLAGLGAGEDDILYYLPARQFFQDCIRDGVWPWLNSWTGMGRPFLADPQNAVFYPPTWLFACLPTGFAFPLSLWLHFSLAMWGMVRLLRAEQLDRRAAFFGGLAFAFCGWMLAHRAHFAMHAAAAWTPWVFWRLRRYVTDAGTHRLASAAAVGALQAFAGHVQVTAITAIGTLVLTVAQRRQPTGSVALPHTPLPDRRRAWHTGGGPLARWLVGWVCAAGLFSVQLVPTLAYVQVCTRVDRTYWDFTENSWNPATLPTWIMPMLMGQRTPNLFDQPWWGPSHQVEQFAYPGIVCLVLAALAFRGPWRADPQRRGWVFLLIVAALLALGKYGPICPLIYWLPGSNLFRVPARALLLCNLAAAALAAIAVHNLAAAPSVRTARLRAWLIDWTARPIAATALLLGSCIGLVLLTAPLLPTEARALALASIRPWSAVVLVPLLIIFASFLLLRAVAQRWERPGLLWSLPALLALDLGVIGWSLDVPAGVTSPGQLLSTADAEPWLRAVRESGARLWVVTDTAGVYTNPLTKGAANTNVLLRVPSLTDYGPLQPAALHTYFQFAAWGVTHETLRLLNDTTWMRACNVGWVLVCDAALPPPNGCDLLLTTPQGWRLFRNASAVGDAFLENAGVVGALTTRTESPYRIIVTVDRYAGMAPDERVRIGLSRVALPGWSVRIDGQPAETETSAPGLLAVSAVIPASRVVEIVWTYSPSGLFAGAGLSASFAALLLVAAAFGARRGAAPAATSADGPAEFEGAAGAIIQPGAEGSAELSHERAADVQSQPD